MKLSIPNVISLLGVAGGALGVGTPLPALDSSPPGKGTGNWARAYDSARLLVDQMTLEEKVNITQGFAGTDNTCAGNTGSVPRLGWPGLCLHDAGNGVRATDMVNAYPAGIHAGATWDKNLTYQRGFYMGGEFKTKGVNVVLGPNAGPLGRSPRGGRNFEGFSVDPYLSGQLNFQTIRGYQDAGVIANIKHFIANEQETYRRPYNGVEAVSSNVDDKTLHEYYLWPFMDSIRAGVASVMCSYNRVNSTYACDSKKLLGSILKTELDFQGFVVLDWNAEHTLNSATAGLDMVMPGEGKWGQHLVEAVQNGTVAGTRVTDMAMRIIAAWYLAGQNSTDFPTPGIGMKNLTQPHQLVDARVPESKPVILEGSIAGHVLLKNKNASLPFRTNPTMLSVYGYDAGASRTKNTDILFQLGYESSPNMSQAVLGTEHHFDQAARGGTIIVGGRAAANSPGFVIDPLSAIQQRAATDGTWINWDLDSVNPEVNMASDACLVFINAMSTEAWDREGLYDDFSDNLVLNVASECHNTIVILHTVGIRLVERWIDHPNVTATIVAHLPGQDSGTALVKLLYGEAYFSGKLPYSIAKNESDYSVYEVCERSGPDDHDPQCDFSEGSYLDYRHLDAKGIAPRFEFGFGLSYTSFGYSSLSISPLAIDQRSVNEFDLWSIVATVEATITNIGHVTGAEVSQLYVSIPNSAPRQLRGFDKTIISPGYSAKVRFELTRRDLSQWDVVSQTWVVQEGIYAISVGASSRDIRLKGSIKVAPRRLVKSGGSKNIEELR
ncbi:family 3 glycoside hydrolase [Xylariales sp. PMI_506]|nr:family 3 glycoside hydrolase [Xylariales sp. PMI_506]